MAKKLGWLAFACTSALFLAGFRAQAKRAQWIPVFQTADYRVELDTANIVRERNGKFGVRLKTWRKRIDMDGGHKFNREIVRTVVGCKPNISFKAADVTLYLNDGPAISTKPGTSVAPGLSWKIPGGTSANINVLRATCDALGQRKS